MMMTILAASSGTDRSHSTYDFVNGPKPPTHSHEFTILEACRLLVTSAWTRAAGGRWWQFEEKGRPVRSDRDRDDRDGWMMMDRCVAADRECLFGSSMLIKLQAPCTRTPWNRTRNTGASVVFLPFLNVDRFDKSRCIDFLCIYVYPIFTYVQNL